MKNPIIYTLFVSLIVVAVSCERTFLGPDEVNNPERVFEILWQDFDLHYALFPVRNRNWDSIYSVYRPQVGPETSNEELWTILTNVIEYLDDGHVSLFDVDNRRQHESGSTLNDLAQDEFDLDLVKSNYLSELTFVDEDSIFSFANFKDKPIGYMHLYGMGDFTHLIEQVMKGIQNNDAIIIDLRNNGGGDADFSTNLAGAFADGEHFVYTAQTRNGPNHDDFDEITKFFTMPFGKEQYLKPVVLLTDRFTASAGEEMTWQMQAFDHVVQLGDTTAGDLSDISSLRFLPNGWLYVYSTQMYLTPDGRTLDGIGLVPDIYFKNTKADIEAGNDLVMERALLYLKEEHGIE